MASNKLLLAIIIGTIAIPAAAYSEESKESNGIDSHNNDTECSLPWHTYDRDTAKCECYNNSYTKGTVKCSDTSVAVLLGYCMTFNENGTFVGSCHNNYPPADYLYVDNGGDDRYITLPSNANHSTLNKYMCGNLNRTGMICSQCIEGYGPTVLQVGFTCAKCEWYGIPLYILLEFGPLTLIFIVLLVFPINITSAPMSCFVMYCQLVSTILAYDQIISRAINSQSQAASILFYAIGTLSNIWNLDFTTFLYFIPPICISSNIKNIHVVLLKYASAAYPLVLISITYIFVELHARNNKVIVWLWRPFHRCTVRTKRVWDPKKSVVDVFASFILLSYSKLLLLSFLSLANTNIENMPLNPSVSIPRYHVLQFDTTVTFLGREHIPVLLFAILVLILFIILPVFLLCCYSMKWFKKCLNTCKPTRNWIALNMFVEKFQQDYCDGLNEHHYDLRSFSGMYMVILAVAYMAEFLLDPISRYTSWFVFTVWIIIAMLMVLIVRPHKKTYMNVISGLFLAMIVFHSLLFNTFLNNYSKLSASELVLPVWMSLVMLSVPQIVFISYLVYKPLHKCGCFKKMKNKLSKVCFKRTRQECEAAEERLVASDEYVEPDRIANPDEYSPLLLVSPASINYDDKGKSLVDQDTY